MGYKRDQDYHGETYRGYDVTASELPPPYTEDEQSTSKAVPALPSRQSAAVGPSNDDSRKKLLLIYVHGFTGNETSFQRFPTDVHDLISKQLVGLYTVQSIVYPKYKSRKKIDFARDEFSGWLREHESDRTDVILLGHSMGGLLAAEVALLPLNSHSATPLRHRILGTVNLDVPFLGIHPGIVASGISSIFRKAPDQSVESNSLSQEPLVTPSSSMDLPRHSTPPSQAEYINTPVISSQVVPTISSLSIDSENSSSCPPEIIDSKQSKLSRALYFINKHSDGLTKATKSYLTSHIEFGGCLVDYKGLMNRYSGIRALEDNTRSRVRFINYYTASTGRPKKQKPPCFVEDGTQDTRSPNLSASDTELQRLTPRASTERDEGDAIDPHVVSSEEVSDDEPSGPCKEGVSDQSSTDLTSLPTRTSPRIPSPIPATVTKPDTTESSALPSTDFLPPLPDIPAKPPPLDASMYPNKDALKIASRDHDRALKTYNRLVKDRDNAIKDRRKLLDKRAKAAPKETRDKGRKLSKCKAKPNKTPTTSITGNDDYNDGFDKAMMTSSGSQPNPDTSALSSRPPTPKPISITRAKAPKSSKEPKPLKYRPFCLLPHQPDPTWIRIVMRDVDEIDAHCGLFAREGEHYQAFVTAVVEKISAWADEASTRNQEVL
ncbi:MAG: hypothetical protein Q9172_000312 [Xanthocarpia lactea]